MIKGIILDVDGVIVGEKIGYNSPYPNEAVIERLKKIRSKGVSISLCTAKPYWAVSKIITDAGLDNLHISEGGAVIIDPIDEEILETHLIDHDEATRVIQSYIEADVYTEIYSLDDYFIQDSQKSELTKTHAHILQREPKMVPSLIEQANKSKIVKIMPIAKDESDRKHLVKIFDSLHDNLTLSWGIHRIALPHLFGIITAKGISKTQAAREIAKAEGIKEEEMLGIGDSTSDWQFIQHCGYGATTANGTPELKELIAAKGTDSFVGGHVDENGVLSIFDYFGL